MLVIEVILNLSLLIAVSVLSGIILNYWQANELKGKLFQGILFGAVALLGMMNPFVLSEGVFFDGRSVIISVCTYFFGPIGGLVAMLPPMVYRIHSGGSGVIMGTSVILSSYLGGLLFYYLRTIRFKEIKLFHFLLMGIFVHAIMIILIITIPSAIRTDTINKMGFTIIIVYPLATVLIGKILFDQQARNNLVEKLSVSEEKFRSLANNMNMGVAVHKIILNQKGETEDFIFEYANDKYEEITGLKLNEIIGKKITEVLPSTPKKTIAQYGEVAISGKPWHFESYSRQRNIYFEAEVYKPSQDHFAVILSDISERKQAERNTINQNKQLSKLISEKDKLFSIVSHDLRSPMNGIMGLTSMIRDDIEVLTNDEIKEISNSIYRSSESVVLLVNSLLEWAQLQRDNYSFNPAKIDLVKVIANNFDLFTETAKAKNITLINLVNKTHQVYADAKMLDTVIRNITNNALKFTPKNGKIEIYAENQTNNKITISIKDNGIGMNNETIEKLFSLSGKINRKGTAGELSSGLGLIICKELIELNSGSIKVESKEGLGTTFLITFNTAPIPN